MLSTVRRHSSRLNGPAVSLFQGNTHTPAVLPYRSAPCLLAIVAELRSLFAGRRKPALQPSNAAVSTQMHRHLHAAAYYLNPRCHYSPDFSTHPEIKLGLFHCLEKLIPNRDDMEKANLQCNAFHSREGFFGLAQAKNTVYKRTPVEWWTQYGDEIPELQKFAVKVLGLTCSSSGCERNWSAFNQVHTKRRNRLTTTRMNALVYILYNKKLKDRHLKLKSLRNDEDSLLIDELPSDDEWLVGENDEDAPHLSVDDFDVDVFEGEPSQATQTQPISSSSKKASASAKGSSKEKEKFRLIDEDEWEDIDYDGGSGNKDDEAIDYNDSSDEVSL
nr:HAT, C-terminal dimerization domain containing protein [Ipomoea batatas]